MTLLELIQTACDEMGLTRPNVVVSSSNLQTRQLLSLANNVGNTLISESQWNRSNKVYTFTLQTDTQNGTTTSGSAVITGLTDTSAFSTDYQVSGTGIPTDAYIVSVNSATQVTIDQEATETGTNSLTFTQTIYDLPSDWNYQLNQTQWDRTNHWALIGPKSPQEWQWLKGAIVSTGPRVRYRILNNKFQIWPLQVNTANLAYEYISTSWVLATGGTEPTKASFTVDTDTCIFRDRLMIAGIKVKFFQAKGLDITNYYREYIIERDKAMAQDKGAPVLSLAPTYNTILISPANVPDGNVYGQS